MAPGGCCKTHLQYCWPLEDLQPWCLYHEPQHMLLDWGLHELPDTPHVTGSSEPPPMGMWFLQTISNIEIHNISNIWDLNVSVADIIKNVTAPWISHCENSYNWNEWILLCHVNFTFFFVSIWVVSGMYNCGIYSFGVLLLLEIDSNYCLTAAVTIS